MTFIPNPRVLLLALVLATTPISARADATPRRIVTLAPSCAEVVAALGLGDRIVGVTDFTDWPPRVKSLPSVGSFTNFSVEAVAALEPDLVVATSDGNPSAALQSLRQIGIRVITMSVRTYAEIEPSILSLGEALGRSAEAKRVVAEMERVASCVAARTGNAHRPRVLFAYEMSPIVTAGASTFNDTLITMSGGVSITHDVSDPFPRLAIETVIARAPEVVIVSSVHPALDAKRWREMLGKWPAIPAVKRGRIHAIDSTNVDRPSQRIVLGLVLLARTIHPSLFARGECRPEFP